jgi:hypothetical protein
MCGTAMFADFTSGDKEHRCDGKGGCDQPGKDPHSNPGIGDLPSKSTKETPEPVDVTTAPGFYG